jgi:hypothetical protein
MSRNLTFKSSSKINSIDTINSNQDTDILTLKKTTLTIVNMRNIYGNSFAVEASRFLDNYNPFVILVEGATNTNPYVITLPNTTNIATMDHSSILEFYLVIDQNATNDTTVEVVCGSNMTFNNNLTTLSIVKSSSSGAVVRKFTILNYAGNKSMVLVEQ